MQSFLLMELQEKILGMQKPCLFLFIKVRQLAVKFPLPRLPVSGWSSRKREGKEQLVLKQRCPFERGMLCMAVQAINWLEWGRVNSMMSSCSSFAKIFRIRSVVKVIIPSVGAGNIFALFISFFCNWITADFFPSLAESLPNYSDLQQPGTKSLTLNKVRTGVCD